ncbi:MAG: ShlB/FhaC/HecB family hemolysin secretion/activation protein [Alphaproteobacteria bacterium]
MIRIGGAAALALAVAMAGTPATAQQTDPGVIDRAPVELPEELEDATGAPAPAEPEREAVANADEVVATFNSIDVSGVEVIDIAQISAATASYVGRALTRGDLAQLKFDITKLYYDAGYILVRVTTPPQDVSDGILEVVVIEARIGSIEVANDGVIEPYLADALTGQVRIGSVFREQEVESMISDLDDLGGVTASLNLRPGEEFGTTDMAVTLNAAEEDVQTISFDNYGSELTEEKVTSLSLVNSNFFGMGETIGLSGRLDTEDDLHSLSITAKAPLGISNWILDTSYTQSQIEVDSIGTNGRSNVFNVAVSSALVNQRRQRFVVRGGFEGRRHETLGTATNNDQIRQFFVSGTYLARLPDLVLFGSLEVRQGISGLGASPEHAPLGDRSRFSGDPGILRLKPLVFVSYQLNSVDTLRAIASGQWSSSTTLASDMFSIGGFGSLRGFEPATASGEAGYQLSLEHSRRFELDVPWLAVRAGAVLRGRRGVRPRPFPGRRLARRSPVRCRPYPGTRCRRATTQSQSAPAGDTNLRLDWAFRLGHYRSRSLDTRRIDRNTILVSLSQTF